jgi:Predicted S-adenosylmethionine-dependent methyltr ansferase
MSEVKGHRKIQSFVKRSGRLSKAQFLGLNNLWSDFGVEINDKELINFDRIFVKQNDITLEVGFGNGDSLLEMAIKQPFQNFIGIEVYEAGVGRIINEASKQNVSNLKIIKDDAVEVIANNIADESISHFQLFFPDPWHKKKHHKRRIVQTSFLDLLSRKLKTNGMSFSN